MRWNDLLAADRIVMLVDPGTIGHVLDAAARLLSEGSPAITPLIADALLGSLTLLRNAVTLFRTACIDTLEADPAACARHLSASTAPALLLVPILGYEAAAALAKASLETGKPIRQLVADKGLVPPETLERMFPSRG